MKPCVWCFVLVLAVGGSAHAQSLEELKRQLDQALKAVDDLQKRVKVLESEKQAAPKPAAPADKAAAPAPAPAPASVSTAAGAVVVAPDS